MTQTSRVLAFPPAASADAARFFAAELAFDADPDDLVRDMQAGHHDGYVVVECRAPESFESLRIPGAINLPYRDLTEESVAGLDRGLVYICYCESSQCNAATKGALALAELGFRVKRLAGGISAWRAAGYPVEGSAAVSGSPTPAPRCTC